MQCKRQLELIPDKFLERITTIVLIIFVIQVGNNRSRYMMSLLSKAKFFVESNVPDVSDISKEDAEKEGKAFSNALGIITDMGINGVDAFLKTDEGKKVSMQIVKHYFQKHWWALAVVAAFNIIEIFATVKFSLSKS